MIWLAYILAGAGAGIVTGTAGLSAAVVITPVLASRILGKTILAMFLGCIIGWVRGFIGSGGILLLTVFILVLSCNLKVTVGTSTMIMTLVALTGAVSHFSMGAGAEILPFCIVVIACLIAAVVSARFANKCNIRRLNRIMVLCCSFRGQ